MSSPKPPGEEVAAQAASAGAEAAKGRPADGGPDERSSSWFIGTDPQQARRRMLYGGIAGLTAAGINLVVAVITYWGDGSVAGVIQPGEWSFLFVLAEAALMTVLSIAVLRRSRRAAALLLGYHLVSKLILFGLAAWGLGPGALRSIPFHLVFAYLFFQGWRGALAWHRLTRPAYPTKPAEE